MDLELSDRVALVTGGASGIGRACVDALIAEGASVGIVDRSTDGEALAKELRERDARVVFSQADVTVESDVIRAVDEIHGEFGRIDLLLGCAGVSGPVGTPLGSVAVAEWDQVMAVNVRGNFLVAKHSIAHLERSDVRTIVFLASDSAFVAFDGMGPYTASKGAVVALARAFAVDHPSVRTNALCPGVVDTPMSRGDMGRPDGFAGSGLPVMSADQLAKQAVFLASPASYPMSGTTLVSDFGYLARSALGALDFANNA
ncbi:SDR family NAD(P)-dependent oxidoreductase [Agromyces sp. M3QZ16-3]|uniref:SDR family NAD(P)-dependent oxidoreductase n=1 Tax=Agromyces sp. M3QZ16-3 TaxID=3447585 RepID=UPI003F69300D